MADVIGVLNQKGGSGKTTIAVNLAGRFKMDGHKVLLLDADPQGSALDWSAAREAEPLVHVVSYPKPTIHKEIENFKGDYDIIIIDGPPRVTAMARSIIVASDYIIIPVQPSPCDIWATQEIVDLVREAQVYREDIKPLIVINRKIINTAIGREATLAVAEFEGIPVFKSSLAQRVVFAEAFAQGKAVFEVDKKGPASKEIRNLTDELMEFIQK